MFSFVSLTTTTTTKCFTFSALNAPIKLLCAGSCCGTVIAVVISKSLIGPKSEQICNASYDANYVLPFASHLNLPLEVPFVHVICRHKINDDFIKWLLLAALPHFPLHRQIVCSPRLLLSPQFSNGHFCVPSKSDRTQQRFFFYLWWFIGWVE